MANACDLAGFAESLRLVNVEYEDMGGGELHEVLVDEDRVAAHRTIRLRNRGAGNLVLADEWICVRVRHGLIAEMASYVDCAKASSVVSPD